MKEFKPEENLEKDIDLDTIKSLPSSYIQEKVVLGIDIYKYSAGRFFKGFVRTPVIKSLIKTMFLYYLYL